MTILDSHILLLSVSLEGRRIILYGYSFQVGLESNLLVTSALVARGKRLIPELFGLFNAAFSEVAFIMYLIPII